MVLLYNSTYTCFTIRSNQTTTRMLLTTTLEKGILKNLFHPSTHRNNITPLAERLMQFYSRSKQNSFALNRPLNHSNHKASIDLYRGICISRWYTIDNLCFYCKLQFVQGIITMSCKNITVMIIFNILCKHFYCYTTFRLRKNNIFNICLQSWRKVYSNHYM